MVNLGNEPGMLDYMVWPWMERLPATTLMSGGRIHFSPLNMPHLVYSLIIQQQIKKVLVYNIT